MPKWLLTLNKKDDNTNTALDDNQLDYEQTPDTDPNCSDSKEDSSINDSDSDSDNEEVPQQHSKYNPPPMKCPSSAADVYQHLGRASLGDPCIVKWC